ncbi:hypothetical protein [Bradyrhizobium liaoningense]|uniref:hypothetical protein n=1 Tax=Bradyrhizobium liaoningense TaxID=43992 RepID=UPI001BA9F494|nr:hypothetical protein [Bradyrhizobium liaoningense]MBR0855691.1 hypothetical protein [Bradyrhizobium liaoningense]
MTKTLRIYDLRDGRVLGLDLRDLIDRLAPRSLEARWIVSPVTLSNPRLGRSHDEFMIVGSAQLSENALEQLAVSKSVVNGITLSEAAHATNQVIWGQFVGMLPEQKEDAWVVVRAIDSTFYEVTSADEAVPAIIQSAYKDVRTATGPVTSIPIEQV